MHAEASATAGASDKHCHHFLPVFRWSNYASNLRAKRHSGHKDLPDGIQFTAVDQLDVV